MSLMEDFEWMLNVHCFGCPKVGARPVSIEVVQEGCCPAVLSVKKALLDYYDIKEKQEDDLK